MAVRLGMTGQGARHAIRRGGMHGPLALGRAAVEQARDRVRAAKSLLERGPRQAERALTSRERKGRACLCGAGYYPQMERIAP